VNFCHQKCEKDGKPKQNITGDISYSGNKRGYSAVFEAFFLWKKEEILAIYQDFRVVKSAFSPLSYSFLDDKDENLFCTYKLNGP